MRVPRPLVPAILLLTATTIPSLYTCPLRTATLSRLAINPTSGNGQVGLTITGSFSSSHQQIPRGPIYLPYLITHTGTSLAASCITYRVIDPSSATLYTADLVWASTTWNALLADYPRCTTTSMTPLISTLTSWWKVTAERVLPIPRVTTTPDYGIVNTPNYLTILGSRTLTFTTNTPVGPVTVSAVGTISIETPTGLQGPYLTLGGPYPDGTILYTSQTPGTFLLSATETWTASYRLGGTSGPLPTVVITGPSDALPVISLRGIVGLPSVLN
jgi:hypothetical protein